MRTLWTKISKSGRGSGMVCTAWQRILMASVGELFPEESREKWFVRMDALIKFSKDRKIWSSVIPETLSRDRWNSARAFSSPRALVSEVREGSNLASKSSTRSAADLGWPHSAA